MEIIEEEDEEDNDPEPSNSKTGRHVEGYWEHKQRNRRRWDYQTPDPRRGHKPRRRPKKLLLTPNTKTPVDEKEIDRRSKSCNNTVSPYDSSVRSSNYSPRNYILPPSTNHQLLHKSTPAKIQSKQVEDD